MESPQITAIDHAQITVPKDMESLAKNFYCEVLGLQEIPKPQNRVRRGGFWIQVGDAQLHVGLEDGVDRSLTKAHVAYRVNDLKLWREKLQRQGIEIFESMPLPGAQSFEFRDPFGNRVELIQLSRK